MAATPVILLITLSSDNSPPQPSLFHITMLSYFTFFIFITLFTLIFTLFTILKNNNDNNNHSNGGEKEADPVKIQSFHLNDSEMIAQQQNQENGSEPSPGNPARSLLLEILPSSSSKWDALFSKSEESDDEPGEKIRSGEEEKKRKKKRARKKRSGPNEERTEKEELVCLYPFTKSSSATQRKIKQQYDQLVKSHGPNGLTIDQVGRFVNCLVEARNELQNKSDVIKRRFTITKALLFKADRSSFDRLRQQIYKLELEQKRLEEDAFVYNWLQEQLKVSSAYKKMLEIGACMEMKEKESSSLVESIDDVDISFEELLAQEKKDAFWQRNGKLKPCSG